MVNEKLEVEQVSDSWIALFGLKTGEIVGHSIVELLDFEDKEWKTFAHRCFSQKTGKKSTSLDLETKWRDSWLRWSSAPWFDERQKVVGLIIQADDITDLKSEKNRNRKLTALLNTTARVAKIGSWEYCFIEKSLTWSEMTRKIHEVSESYVPTVEDAINFYKIGHSRNTISMCLHEATEKGSSWSERLQLVTAKDRTVWVQASGKPIFDEGKLIALTGTFQCLEEQVRLETKTSDNEKLLRTLVDNLPLNVFIKDTESRKILVNKSECEYLGVKDASEILGKTDFELYDKDMAETSRREDLKVMETLTPLLSKETVSRKKNGQTSAFLTSKIPLMGDDGKANGLVGISIDISEIKQKEEELRDLVNVASLQNKKLIDFAHIVSHNLRSHTANFSMLLDFLVNEENEEEKNSLVKMLTKASDNLLETMDNLNEVLVINTSLDLDKKTINLKERIDTIHQNLSEILGDNQAELVNYVEQSVQLDIIPQYIDDILTNFITNAVKYKHPDRNPQIILSATCIEGYTVLSIADNGLGIDLKKYGDKLFGMYKTFHDHCEARGIGLYITKNQIEAMNGKITVESEPGTGTNFKIYFNEEN